MNRKRKPNLLIPVAVLAGLGVAVYTAIRPWRVYRQEKTKADEMRREMTSLQQSDLKRRSSNQLMNPVEKEEDARRLGYVKPDELPLKSQKAENNAPDGQ